MSNLLKRFACRLVFTKEILIDSKVLCITQPFHSVESTEIYSHSFLAKNFVKVIPLLRSLLSSWFDEIFIRWEWISVISKVCNRSSHCTVWKNEKFSLTEKKFRQIIYLVISIVKLMLSRNFCEKSVRDNFCNFHTVHCSAHCDNFWIFCETV